MATVSHEECDRCRARIPEEVSKSWLRSGPWTKRPYPHVEIDIKHAKYGWGKGSDNPRIRGSWVLCEDCYARFLAALTAFIDTWEG